MVRVVKIEIKVFREGLTKETILRQDIRKLGVVVHICNPSIQETEAR
jgi:hypothetical protein